MFDLFNGFFFLFLEKITKGEKENKIRRAGLISDFSEEGKRVFFMYIPSPFRSLLRFYFNCFLCFFFLLFFYYHLHIFSYYIFLVSLSRGHFSFNSRLSSFQLVLKTKTKIKN